MAKKQDSQEVDTNILDVTTRMGRPSAYKPEFAVQAEKLCKLGATDHELAEFFDVTDRTIFRWKNQFLDFCQAVNSGKELLDDRVERSLYHRAVGYSHDSVQINVSKDGDVYETPFVKHYPPDTSACMNWLANRRKDKWRKTDGEGEGSGLKDLMEFTLKIGKAAGAIEERKRLADTAIDGNAKKLKPVHVADPEE